MGSLGPNLESIENSSSTDELLIDADTREAALKAASELYHAVSFVMEGVKGKTLTVQTRCNGLSCARNALNRLDAVLDAEADRKQEAALKQNMLRQANLENHRLREEMGKAVSLEAIGNKLYQLDRTIYYWWQGLGFAYSKSELCPHSHGATFKVEFSVRVDNHLNFMEREKTPVSSKAKKDAKIQEMASALEIADKGGENYVVDTPANRQWIIDKITTRFPGARIWEWKSWHIHKSVNDFSIRDVIVNIDMVDIGETTEWEQHGRV